MRTPNHAISFCGFPSAANRDSVLHRRGRCGQRSARRRDRTIRAPLDQIINLKHELVLLAGKIDWDCIDGEIAPRYCENGRPPIETRFMIGLLLLKQIYEPSDEGGVFAGSTTRISVFTGEEFFQHAFPHERSDLSHWRKRLGDKDRQAGGGKSAGGQRCEVIEPWRVRQIRMITWDWLTILHRTSKEVPHE